LLDDVDELLCSDRSDGAIGTSKAFWLTLLPGRTETNMPGINAAVGVLKRARARMVPERVSILLSKLWSVPL